MASSGSFPDVLPEMNIKESNGEVSASIAETNRVRALLGLKPLNVGSASSSQKPNKQKQQKSESETKKRKISANAIEKLHQKLSNKHRLNATVRGISLSEELQSNNLENYSALDWVQKSRNLQKKQQQRQFEQKLDDLYGEEEDILHNEEDGTKHLKGKVVDHSISDFKKGETKILILKDSKILDDKMEINEDADELINVAMFEEEQRKNKFAEAENIARNRKYNPLDDENYNVLLPQYEEKKKKMNGSFVLNEDGKLDKNAQTNKILNELNAAQSVEKNENKKMKFDAYDLSNLNKHKVESDFIVKFKKKKRKKKKKKRKRTEDDENGQKTASKRRKMNENDDSNEKYAFLDDDNEHNVNGKSRGKRNDILNALKLSEIEEKEEKERLDRYNIALQKANKSMEENLALNNILNEFEKNNDGINSDDDDIFNANLVRAEKLKNKKDKNQNLKDKDMEDNEGKNESVIFAENPNEDGVEFSIATQFSDGLCGAMNQIIEENHANIQQQQQQMMENDAISTENNEKNGDVEDDDIAMANESKGGWVECDEQSKDKNEEKESKKEQQQQNEANGGNEILDSSILDREPLCARSLSDTLSHIRRRGYFHDEDGANGNKLKANRFEQSHIGISASKKEEICKKWDVDSVLRWLKREDRYLYNKYAKNFETKRIDGAKLINSCGSSSFLRGVIGMKNGHFNISKFMNILGKLKGDPAPDITLSHQDEFGKPMSKKEAFRTLSHKFHGKKSGPKKQEKRLKKQQLELMRKKIGSVDTPLGTLQKLKTKTKAMNKPFVVLDKS